MQDHDGLAELPRAKMTAPETTARNDPAWGGATAVAELSASPAKASSRSLPEAASSSTESVEAIPPRRPSTAILGGCFASVIFHFWLMAMLASLGIDLQHCSRRTGD